MKWLFTFIILFKILLPSSLAAQSGAQVSILSYNVENLFDTIDDPISRDSEFTPTGKKEWNSSKYWTKIKRLNKVFLSLDSCLPDLIALTEIENESVLKDIIRTNQFLKEYEFITYESGDRRGIQNAILYNKTKFKLLYSSIRAPRDSTGNILVTRDILWASFEFKKDTITLFVNHWPSRYGGILKSEPTRILASQNLLYILDSLSEQNFGGLKIACGDFNDEVKNNSIQELLRQSSIEKVKFLNNNSKLGTHKYKSRWSEIDHFFIQTESHCKVLDCSIIHESFLLKGEDLYSSIPYRTFQGNFFIGGYSDHLPIYLKIMLE